MTYRLALAAISICGLCLTSASALDQSARPNILLAIADDWGWPHASIYGDPVVKTPTFDRIAREGILFNHAYVSSPSCTPSRAAILTGQFHWRLEESANLWSTLRKEIPTYPELLEKSGYFVGLQGKGWGPGRLEPGGRTQNPAGKHYRSFAEFLQARPEGKPFCFWFGSGDPHRGYQKGSGAASGMQLDKIRLPACFPDSEEVRSDVADYYWEVQRFDRQVGQMLKLLEDRGELNNTLIVMTGDHGMPFPRCKGNLYDSGTRVPLAIRWGSNVQQQVSDNFISLCDLAPTFLQLANVEVPTAMTGHSFHEMLGGKSTSQPPRDYIVFGKERHVPGQEAPNAGGTPMRGIRTNDYLLIRNYEPDRWPAGTPNYQKAHFPGAWYADVDNGPTKSYMIDNKERDETHRRLFALAFQKRPAVELYDLQSDPQQLRNVADDPSHAQARRTLETALQNRLESTADPRASGQGEKFDTFPYYGGAPKHPGWR